MPSSYICSFHLASTGKRKVTPCQPHQFVALLSLSLPGFLSMDCFQFKAEVPGPRLRVRDLGQHGQVPFTSFPSGLAFLYQQESSRCSFVGRIYALSIHATPNWATVLLLRTVCWCRCNPLLCVIWWWAAICPAGQGTDWSLKMRTSTTWQLCVLWTTFLGSGILMLK